MIQRITLIIGPLGIFVSTVKYRRTIFVIYVCTFVLFLVDDQKTLYGSCMVTIQQFIVVSFHTVPEDKFEGTENFVLCN